MGVSDTTTVVDVVAIGRRKRMEQSRFALPLSCVKFLVCRVWPITLR